MLGGFDVDVNVGRSSQSSRSRWIAAGWMETEKGISACCWDAGRNSEDQRNEGLRAEECNHRTSRLGCRQLMNQHQETPPPVIPTLCVVQHIRHGAKLRWTWACSLRTMPDAAMLD